MKKTVNQYFLALFGLILTVLGFYLVITKVEVQGIIRVPIYIIISLGTMIFCHVVKDIVSYRSIKNHPDVEKQQKIDQQDERNVTICNSSKAKAYDMMMFIYGVLTFTLIFMKIEISAVLLFFLAYSFVLAYEVFYRAKLDKEM